jgi:hypothetical protein
MTQTEKPELATGNLDKLETLRAEARVRLFKRLDSQPRLGIEID